uniref:Uncharacterized protein n=1 Tax=Mustela putorius furo TaxID=9669 RepID=M3XUX9_MUSPF
MRTVETEPRGRRVTAEAGSSRVHRGEQGGAAGRPALHGPHRPPAAAPPGGRELPRAHLPPRRCRAQAARETRPQATAAPPVGPASGSGAPGLRSCAPPPPPARAPARDPATAGPTQHGYLSVFHEVVAVTAPSPGLAQYRVTGGRRQRQSPGCQPSLCCF